MRSKPAGSIHFLWHSHWFSFRKLTFEALVQYFGYIIKFDDSSNFYSRDSKTYFAVSEIFHIFTIIGYSKNLQKYLSPQMFNKFNDFVSKHDGKNSRQSYYLIIPFSRMPNIIYFLLNFTLREKFRFWNFTIIIIVIQIRFLNSIL